MASKDGEDCNCLTECIKPFVILFVGYILFRKFGKGLNERFFASFWSKKMVEYHSRVKEIKLSHFSTLTELRAEHLQHGGPARILEIGAGPGANFEFYPPKSKLSVVEPNAFFQTVFYENQKKYPDVKMDRFIQAMAEDMKEIENASVDIVVSTLVLCSVTSIEKVLEEVSRVLTPGGKFYFWEHVHDRKGTWLHLIQSVATYLVFEPVFNCHLNRNSGDIIKASPHFSSVDHKRFDIPMRDGLLWPFIKVHVMGVATK